MPNQANDVIGKPIGISGSQHLSVLHAVDITDTCDGNPKERKLLKFTRDGQDVIVVITRCYEGQSDLGTSAHWYTSEFALEDTPNARKFRTFREFANDFNMTTHDLLVLIMKHLEAVPRA